MNTALNDAVCQVCGDSVQIKAIRRGTGQTLTSGDYYVAMSALVRGIHGHLAAVVHTGDGNVTDVWVAPKHLIPQEAVTPMPRRLGLHAARPGTLNSYIHLREIPTDARVFYGFDGYLVEESEIQRCWNSLLSTANLDDRPLLAYVADIVATKFKRGTPFDEKALLGFGWVLAEHHPGTKSLRKQIHRAVGELCSIGIVEEVGKDRYRTLPTRQQAVKMSGL